MGATTDLMQDARAILIVDTKLQAFCTGLGKTLQVHIGFDPEKGRADDGENAHVSIVGVTQSKENCNRVQSFEMVLRCALHNENVTADDNGEIFEGFLQIEDFREAALNVLLRSKLGKVSTTEDTSEDNSAYPEFIAEFAVLIEQIKK